MRRRVRNGKVVDGIDQADSEVRCPDSISKALGKVRVFRSDQPLVKLLTEVGVLIEVLTFKSAWSHVDAGFRASQTASKFLADKDLTNPWQWFHRFASLFGFSTPSQFREHRGIRFAGTTVDDPREDICERRIIVLRPTIKRMLVALSTIQSNARESDGRQFGICFQCRFAIRSHSSPEQIQQLSLRIVAFKRFTTAMDQLLFVAHPFGMILAITAGPFHNAADHFRVRRVRFKTLAKPVVPHLGSASPHSFIFAHGTDVAFRDVAHTRRPQRSVHRMN